MALHFVYQQTNQLDFLKSTHDLYKDIHDIAVNAVSI